MCMNDKDLLDIYTDCLISSFGQPTQTGLSRLLNGAISPDRINAFCRINFITALYHISDISLLVNYRFNPYPSTLIFTHEQNLYS